MAHVYPWYIASCVVLFIGMQFHWYGKYPYHHRFDTNKRLQTSTQLAHITTELHKTVDTIITLRNTLHEQQAQKQILSTT